MTISVPCDAAPWWRYPIMWLVVGGPLAVVVAGIATMVIAFRGADPVLVAVPDALARNAVPALIGRNHAATPAPR